MRGGQPAKLPSLDMLLLSTGPSYKKVKITLALCLLLALVKWNFVFTLLTTCSCPAKTGLFSSFTCNTDRIPSFWLVH